MNRGWMAPVLLSGVYRATYQFLLCGFLFDFFYTVFSSYVMWKVQVYLVPYKERGYNQGKL